MCAKRFDTGTETGSFAFPFSFSVRDEILATIAFTLSGHDAVALNAKTARSRSGRNEDSPEETEEPEEPR
jgi:hypothetical protein